ncbi:hypothetical protein Hamer_G000639 [Homarus americanus]|uniref:Uncharacterized protein n=8 Tax=Homarus americanus TaxID=6706 RepID=A0A8J5NBC0_HOMAM|nr:hypothetical protein Hamer_G000639 [Homarus americanus]
MTHMHRRYLSGLDFMAWRGFCSPAFLPTLSVLGWVAAAFFGRPQGGVLLGLEVFGQVPTGWLCVDVNRFDPSRWTVCSEWVAVLLCDAEREVESSHIFSQSALAFLAATSCSTRQRGIPALLEGPGSLFPVADVPRLRFLWESPLYRGPQAEVSPSGFSVGLSGAHLFPSWGFGLSTEPTLALPGVECSLVLQSPPPPLWDTECPWRDGPLWTSTFTSPCQVALLGWTLLPYQPPTAPYARARRPSTAPPRKTATLGNAPTPPNPATEDIGGSAFLVWGAAAAAAAAVPGPLHPTSCGTEYPPSLPLLYPLVFLDSACQEGGVLPALLGTSSVATLDAFDSLALCSVLSTAGPYRVATLQGDKELINDMIVPLLHQWTKANALFKPPVINQCRTIELKLTKLWHKAVETSLGKGNLARKNEFLHTLDTLFDILTCKCSIQLCSESNCSHSGKRENNSHIDCGCPREKKIPVLELEFIKAQRTKAEGQGSMQMGSIDYSETKKQIANAKKREQIREREQKKKMKSEEAIQREEELCQDVYHFFDIPPINVNATKLSELVDLSLEVLEPPLTTSLTSQELRNLKETPMQVPKWPSHTQSVERCVKMVTEAAGHVYSHERREASDASDLGLGYHSSSGHQQFGGWTDEWRTTHINVRELYLAWRFWEDNQTTQDETICFEMDSTAAVFLSQQAGHVTLSPIAVTLGADLHGGTPQEYPPVYSSCPGDREKAGPTLSPTLRGPPSLLGWVDADTTRGPRCLHGGLEQVDLHLPVPAPCSKVLLQVCHKLRSFKGKVLLLAGSIMVLTATRLVSVSTDVGEHLPLRSPRCQQATDYTSLTHMEFLRVSLSRLYSPRVLEDILSGLRPSTTRQYESY